MDAVKIEEQRTEQAWRYAGVACLIFVFMSGVLWLFNYRIGAIVCTAQTFVLLILMVLGSIPSLGFASKHLCRTVFSSDQHFDGGAGSRCKGSNPMANR